MTTTKEGDIKCRTGNKGPNSRWKTTLPGKKPSCRFYSRDIWSLILHSSAALSATGRAERLSDERQALPGREDFRRFQQVRPADYTGTLAVGADAGDKRIKQQQQKQHRFIASKISRIRAVSTVRSQSARHRLAPIATSTVASRG